MSTSGPEQDRPEPHRPAPDRAASDRPPSDRPEPGEAKLGPTAAQARNQLPPIDQLRARRRSGDGWIETPQGRFWGKYGAAGLLIWDHDRGVLLQHRVAWSAHGGTWGIPGGAIDADETPTDGAIRECHEEAGVPALDGSGIRILDTHIVDKDGWAYTTVVAEATTRLDAYVADIESLELRWVPLDEVTDYPLHPGFAAAWPQLRTLLGN